MIPQEAIEAAAKAVWQWWEENCASNSEAVTGEDRSVATAALEAAAPYLIREARAAELEAAAIRLGVEGASFQESWGSNARDLAKIEGITQSVHWLSVRAVTIRKGGQ